MSYIKIAIIKFSFLALGTILTGCNYSSNGVFLKEIMSKGEFCTQKSLQKCRLEKHLILTPDDLSVSRIVYTRNFELYVPPEACVDDYFLLADIEGRLYSFCQLDNLPSDFTLSEKLESIERELR